MHAIRVLLYKGFARYLRNRMAVALTFVVPIAMIYIFGWVFGLNRKDPGPVGIRLAVVDELDNPATRKLIQVLKAEKAFNVITTFTNPDKTTRPLVDADLRPLIRDGAFRFAVVIPKAANEGRSFGLHLKFLSNPSNDIETQMVNGLLQKAIFSHVPELLGQSLQARARDWIGAERYDKFNESLADAIAKAFDVDRDEALRDITSGDFGLSRLRSELSAAGSKTADGKTTDSDIFSRIVGIENEQVVGRDVRSPAATRVVGGWAIMMLMFALNGAAASQFEEQKSGMFQRLLAAPVTRADILWSRFLFGVVLGLAQLVTVFLAGQFLYGIDVTSHLGNLAVVCVAAAAACTALGMFIASISTSQESAMGIATLVIMTMSACGGAWFPISFMPEFMQQAARFTITYWAIEGFGQVLWAGKSFLQLLPNIGILLGITAGVMALAVWRFNRSKIFD